MDSYLNYKVFSEAFQLFSLGSEAKVIFVDVSPCPTQPCELKRGTNVSIEIQFIPSKY